MAKANNTGVSRKAAATPAADEAGSEPEIQRPLATIHSIDFRAHDSEEALQYLQSIHDAGQLGGLIFAVRIKRRPGLLYGTTGNLADDEIISAGAAVKLLFSILQQETTF